MDHKHTDECPHCAGAGARVFELRKRIRAQLQAWKARPDHETCLALLTLAVDCLATVGDGPRATPDDLQWFLTTVMKLATGSNTVQTTIINLDEQPSEGN